MLVGAAFCPHPPVLVPEVARGAAGELEELRAACRSAIRSASTKAEHVVIVGAGPASEIYPTGATGTLAGYGVPLQIGLGRASSTGRPTLPPALTVGAWLLADALGPDNGAWAMAVGPDGADIGPALPDGELAVLALGDGSARRSTAAPGYLDDRAEEFDAGVAAALASGDGGLLDALDPQLGAELLAAGVPTWRAVGRILGDGWRAQLRFDAAPYGVGYFAADWTRDG